MMAACGGGFDMWDSKTGCMVFSGSPGGRESRGGDSALVLGIKRHHRYKEWRRARMHTAAWFEHLVPTGLASTRWN